MKMKQWFRKVSVLLHLDEVWYGRSKLRSIDRNGKRYQLRYKDFLALENQDISPEVEINEEIPLLPDCPSRGYASVLSAQLKSETQAAIQDCSTAETQIQAQSSEQSEHNHLAGIRSLTTYQKSVLRNTWKGLTSDNSHQSALRIYRHLGRATGNSKRNLANVNFGMVKLLVRTMEHSIKNVESPEQLKIVYIQVGRTLVYLDGGQMVSQKKWDNLALCLMEYCTSHITRDKWHKEAMRAWAIFISYIVDYLNLGYQAEVKIAKYLATQQFIIRDRVND